MVRQKTTSDFAVMQFQVFTLVSPIYNLCTRYPPLYSTYLSAILLLRKIYYIDFLKCIGNSKKETLNKARKISILLCYYLEDR